MFCRISSSFGILQLCLFILFGILFCFDIRKQYIAGKEEQNLVDMLSESGNVKLFVSHAIKQFSYLPYEILQQFQNQLEIDLQDEIEKQKNIRIERINKKKEKK
jgi:hypothetical protein